MFLEGRALSSSPITREVTARRVRQRRQMHLVQAFSYSLGTLDLLLYSYAGTVSISVPSVFWVSGLVLIGFFAVLSDIGFNDRFEDHYLTVFQVSGHLALQLGFLVAVPKIGFAFISVLFLVFAFGALRMTSRQAAITWTLLTAGLIAIFLFSDLPIGMPLTNKIERLAALLCVVLVIGQCAFLGLFGSTLRKTLYRRSVELKEAYRRIEELAELDELTGSFNRRSIMRILEEELVRTQRSDAPCSIALIDLDFFKRINDAYGHPTGDEVLRTFAITTFANIRTIDRFGRYGGEEFLLVLPDTSEDAAFRMLDRLRAIIAELDWSAFSPGMRVTISAGVATLRGGETSDNFLARADSALYASKARGRNRITNA
ncbi:MAG TPA: GGDEF domain-containing protein [Bradyrhizobium sp.]|nr:GGDEF domain-containing protein [Bradyrhizobium sp.]HLZ05533.1 GGDEF domain-containing protein [Bradyrhizobium sp.]